MSHALFDQYMFPASSRCFRGKWTEGPRNWSCYAPCSSVAPDQFRLLGCNVDLWTTRPYNSAWRLLLLRVLFDLEDVDNEFPRNVWIFPNYMELQPRQRCENLKPYI
jgi:hypothetical protein